MNQLLNNFGKLLRWRTWGVPKLSILFCVYFYVILRRSLFGEVYIVDFFLLAALLSSYMAFGHVVNDYSDREVDRLAGKSRNVLSSIPNLTARLVVLSSLAITILLAIPFLSSPMFLPLFATSLFIASFYSLKPLRFKEKGALGLISVILSVELLPLLIVFSVLGHSDLVDIVMFSIFYVSWGMKEITKHQLVDFDDDMMASVNTFAIKRGRSLTLSLYSWFYAVERITLSIILVWIALQIPLTIPATLAYFLLMIGALLQSRRISGLLPLEPQRDGRTAANLYPRFVLPICFLVILMSNIIYFIAPFLFFLAWNAKLISWLLTTSPK